MSNIYWAVAFVLCLNLMAATWRALRGPSIADSMLVMQLFGSSVVAILLVISEAIGASPLKDIALVFALLSAVTVIACIRREWSFLEPDTDAD